MRLSLSNANPRPDHRTVNSARLRAWLAVVVISTVLTACASPAIDDVPTATIAIPTPTPTVAAPTAAVGATLGSSCESGKLRFGDLPAMDEGWRDGLAIARGRALDWQLDAVLVELRVACELFEPGFRWQATYFSREAQAYYSSDTAEVTPVEIDPGSVVPLAEEDIRFVALQQILASNGYSDDDAAMRLESLRLLMSTDDNRVGPPDLPADHAIGHLRIVNRGTSIELYVDLTAGGIYRYGDR